MGEKLIKQYLQEFNKLSKGKGHYGYALKCGNSFSSPGKLTPNEKKLLKKCRYSTKSRECYYNSQMLNICNPKFKYYEGWYLFEDIPIPLEHGFNVINGKVVDTTQFTERKSRKRNYFGINIPSKFVRKNMEETEMAEAMLYKYARSKKGKC